MPELHQPAHPWYVAEAAEHERRQAAVNKAVADARKRTLSEGTMTTIREQIEELVQREATRRYNYGFGRSNPGYSVQKAKVEVWAEPEGRILQGLIRSDYADMTAPKAKAAVFKSKNPGDREALDVALRTLEAGFPR